MLAQEIVMPLPPDLTFGVAAAGAAFGVACDGAPGCCHVDAPPTAAPAAAVLGTSPLIRAQRSLVGTESS